MKKILALVLAFVSIYNASTAQKSGSDFLKRPALGIHFFLSDFKTADAIRQSSLSSVLQNKQWSKISKMTPGLAVSYLKGLTNHIDFEATLGASFLDYPIRNRVPFGTDNLLLDVNAVAHLKLTSDKYWISPYLTAGVGVSKYEGYFGAYAPLGAGLQINFFDDAFLLINSQYRISVTENTNYHLYNSIGIAGNIGKPRQAPPVAVVPVPVPEVPKDTDGDGIVDADDACPTVPGTAAFKGCPDSDGDGIADKDDKCPNQPGVAKYEGCPVPDSDGDGINDDNDRCPNQPGVAKYQGCPIPDGDGDGINDDEDRCPTVPGIAENNGCPEIKKADIEKVNYAAKNIFFATGSAKLLPKSYKPLLEVAKILEANPSMKLAIDGHTDNTGKADKNQTLSESRASAVMTYLAENGVGEDRMTATGYGQDQPVGDNKTAAGRAKNRRVELKLSY
jgi:OmpA-OmpF porin, OOP family